MGWREKADDRVGWREKADAQECYKLIAFSLIPLCPARDKADAQECYKLTGAGNMPADDLKVYFKSATTFQLKE